MRYVFLLLIAWLLSPLAALHAAEPPVQREFTIAQRYLHLPVKDGATPHRMRFMVDGKQVREFMIEFAEAAPDLYVADEMFVCGTAAEVSAVNSVDDRAIPCPGPMTSVIAEEYGRAVRGQVDKYKEWCELV